MPFIRDMHSLKLSILLLLLATLSTLAQVREGGALRLIESLNTQKDDLWPCFSGNGKEIYFSRKSKSRDSDQGSMVDIYVTKNISKGKWFEPKLIEKLSGGSETAIGHISVDGSRFYVQGSFINPKSKKLERGIFLFAKTGEAWHLIEKLQIPYFVNKSLDQSFCMNKDENVLIISMQHYSTRGVEDLYFSKKGPAGKWSELTSLGKQVNTEFEDFSPWLDQDGRTLYFSSNGFDTHGSKDIFVTYRLDETWKNWTPPLNLGKRINSEGMELAFRRSPVEKDLFLLVAAQSSDGHSDLYQYFFPDTLLPNPKKIFGINEAIPQRDSLAPIQFSDQNRIKVVAMNRDRNHAIPFSATLFTPGELFLDSIFIMPGDTGEFNVFQDTVFLKVASPEHLSYEKRIVFQNSTVAITSYETIYLDSLESGKPIKLENVLFTKGTPELLPSSYLQLDRVLEFMEDHLDRRIQLIGHTDIAGNAELNQKLSEDRAKAIRSYLVNRGIKGNRIQTKGLGGDQPLSKKRDEKSKMKNRRVEFVIL